MNSLVEIERAFYDTRSEKSRLKNSFSKNIYRIGIKKLIVDYLFQSTSLFFCRLKLWFSNFCFSFLSDSNLARFE